MKLIEKQNCVDVSGNMCFKKQLSFQNYSYIQLYIDQNGLSAAKSMSTICAAEHEQMAVLNKTSYFRFLLFKLY